MTYSIKVRAQTKSECKARVTRAFSTQVNGQPAHGHDRVHIERLIYALIDAHKEDPQKDIVVDAYGYVNITGSGDATNVTANLKVYSAHHHEE